MDNWIIHPFDDDEQRLRQQPRSPAEKKKWGHQPTIYFTEKYDVALVMARLHFGDRCDWVRGTPPPPATNRTMDDSAKPVNTAGSCYDRANSTGGNGVLWNQLENRCFAIYQWSQPPDPEHLIHWEDDFYDYVTCGFANQPQRASREDATPVVTTLLFTGAFAAILLLLPLCVLCICTTIAIDLADKEDAKEVGYE